MYRTRVFKHRNRGARSGVVGAEDSALRLPLLALLLVALLAGCAARETTVVSDEARCRQQGGIWRTTFCESTGGGGY